ncbi:MAG: SLC13 family permease, partial [Pseudomonadota bacterium]
LSNNATALIFTPIAVNIAYETGIDPMAAAITVLLAANCCFLTPIGYQTNLLIVGPGHYRFRDFVWAGAPLTLLLALTFVLAAPFVFNL